MPGWPDIGRLALMVVFGCRVAGSIGRNRWSWRVLAMVTDMIGMANFAGMVGMTAVIMAMTADIIVMVVIAGKPV